MASDFWKWFYFGLVGLFSPFAFFFENLARTLSPATLGHHRLCCCLCCCAAAVLLLWCWCGVAVVFLMVVVVLLSRLCENEALPRTQPTRCDVVCVTNGYRAILDTRTQVSNPLSLVSHRF